MQKRNDEDLMISIVMPVYNAENYLDRTINCVVSQTYPHWELILVDDCSSDSSLTICRKWAEKDDRIRVLHHEQNMGIARTRSDGINDAGGGYIGFIDNDDIIHPQMYETLAAGAKLERAGIIMCNSMKLADGAEASIELLTSYEAVQERLGKECAYSRLFGTAGIDWQYLAMWNKIYRAEIAKAIPLTSRGCEDGAFNCTAIRMANGITKLNTKPLYFWVQHSQSTSHVFRKRNIEVLGDYFTMADEIAAHEPQCYHSVALKTFKVVLNTRYNSRKTEYYSDVLQLTRRRFPEFYKSFWKCREISTLWKCTLSIFYYFPFTYNLFRAYCG